MARRRSKTLDFSAYALLRGAIFVLGVLPQWLSYPLAGALGRVYLRLSRRRREIALANLRQALGETIADDELQRIARTAIANTVKLVVDLARLPRVRASGRFADFVDCDEIRQRGEEAAALAGGRAPILCAPHLGSWEVGSNGAGLHWSPLHIIMRRFDNPFLDRYVLRSRSLFGQEMHPRRGGIKALKEALVRDEAVALMPDQNQRLRGVFVPFFGKLASCDRAPASLAIHSGHPVLALACLRVGGGFRFRFRVLPPMLLTREEGESRDEAQRRGILRINRAMEELIRARPEQYLWIHNRYRKRPPAEAEDGARA